MEKSSSNLQLAISSLVATIIFSGLAVAFALGRVPGMPIVAAFLNGTVLTVAVLFLPLLWWRHKAGYAGGIAIGVFGIIHMIVFTLPDVPEEPQGLPSIVAFLAISVALIVSAYRASREKA